jgi:hypothetical protein
LTTIALAGLLRGGVEPEPFAESPLLGGGIGQTARITIVATGDLCEATLGFRDSKGGPVPDDSRVRTVLLKKGETAFHDLNFNAFVNKLGQRYEIRALVRYPSTAGHDVCRWSAEIFDQFSKRTTLIYGHPPDPIAPHGDGETHLAPLGGAFGQTVRMGVVADSPEPAGRLPEPPAPCAVEVHLHSATGALLASKEMKLAPGQADFLDLNMSRLVRFAERAGIAPCTMPVAPGSAAGCKVSVAGVRPGDGVVAGAGDAVGRLAFARSRRAAYQWPRSQRAGDPSNRAGAGDDGGRKASGYRWHRLGRCL